MLGCFDDPFTGAERELLDLSRMIAWRRPVQLWSSVPPHAFYAGQGVQGLQAFANFFPKAGTLLIAGVHVVLGPWLKYAHLDRVIVLYNLVRHERLFAMLQSLRDLTNCEPELVFVSRALQLSTGLPGRVMSSFIDIEPFLQVSRSIPSNRPFTVGRISRDIPEKHHDQDPSLYRMLAAQGVRVRVMGGTCLAAELRGVENVELLPSGSHGVADFYQSLDVFFYRPGAWVEAYGRVVLEAMASGLPVVADDAGGYAELIRPGVTGWMVRSQEEAFDTLMALFRQPLLAHHTGLRAREDAVARHGTTRQIALIEDWLL